MLSIQLLDEYCKADEIVATHVATYELNQFPPHTCLSMAVAADNLEFVSHGVCQYLLNDAWSGAIRGIVTTRSIFFGILCPFYVPFGYKFRNKKELEQMIKAEYIEGEDFDLTDDDETCHETQIEM